MGHRSSGVMEGWQADADGKHYGINTVEFTDAWVQRFAEHVGTFRQKGDVVVASVHWGVNWSWEIPQEQQEFARKLVDVADVDIVHGHSSHHFKGIELYKGRLLMYGAGDILTDYEGIKEGTTQLGDEVGARGDLGFMYFVDYDAFKRRVDGLTLKPTLLRHLRIELPTETDVQLALQTIQRECEKFGLKVQLDEGNQTGHHFVICGL
eukprot:gnl/TRDRNA2_/TRDRNA2_158623_c0_seq1.p1 gnl/TRDRNA2_/TRDRNA2_158623_c0~~gnl/TRDRNA2_/TRDRNA2_158623_c0_seq1.p1  ORF type:complete len:208 (-),score=23.74 gnl/TRDRNA2_/TRDRNA2_158623_c0_seq1:142-765(-)